MCGDCGEQRAAASPMNPTRPSSTQTESHAGTLPISKHRMIQNNCWISKKCCVTVAPITMQEYQQQHCHRLRPPQR